MKISKQRLAEIIKEEIAAEKAAPTIPVPDQESKPSSDEAGPKTSDAKTLIARIPSIDLPNEYEEVLVAILKHDVKMKDVIIKKVFGAGPGSAILKMLGGK